MQFGDGAETSTDNEKRHRELTSWKESESDGYQGFTGYGIQSNVSQKKTRGGPVGGNKKPEWF